jgi:hypothetical protein
MYIKTDLGKIGVQLDRPNEWGFSLFDSSDEYPGGFGFQPGSFHWREIPKPADRIASRFGWILEMMAEEREFEINID